MVAERGVWPPQERTPEKTCEQVVDFRVRQVVEQVLAVPKNSSQDRNLQGTVEQIPDDPMLGKAEQLEEVPETVSRDGVQQRTVEQIVGAPVSQAVEESSEVSKVFSQGRIQQRIVGQIIPAIPLAEKIVELPVEQTEEKTQRDVNTHVQHVVNAVEVERPKTIELTVQRKKPIIQEKIDQVTKHVEIPQFTDKVVDVPVVAQKQISMTLTVQKNIEISQLQVDDKMVDVPVMLVVLVPQVRIVKKTVGDSQLQIVEKTIENPETQISDACLTCDAKCKVACETCVKDNMFMVTGEMSVAGKRHRETAVRGIAQNAEIDSFIDNLSSVGSQWLNRGSKQRKQHQDKPPQATRQSTQREREKERGGRGQKEEGEKGQEERESLGKGERGKEEGRDAEEEEDKQVKKDVTGWTVVTRNKRQRKMVQIFVKVDEAKVIPMDVSLTDGKIEDVMRQVQKGEDVYVTMQGRVPRRNEKLKSCGVTDGCTIQVTSRLRGGGRHKDKKSKAEKRPDASAKQPEPLQMEKVLEEMVACIVEGSDVEGEQRLQSFLATIQKSTGWDKGLLENMECRIRQVVEEKRRENIEERDQVTEQEQSKKVSFAEEKRPEETQEQSTDKQDVMSGLEEPRDRQRKQTSCPRGR